MIDLPPDIEADLAAQADAHGVPLPEYLRHLLEEHASAGTHRVLTPDQRAAAWRAFAENLPRTPPLSDDAISRASIYHDRG
jgi:hypothetical protein